MLMGALRAVAVLISPRCLLTAKVHVRAVTNDVVLASLRTNSCLYVFSV